MRVLKILDNDCLCACFFFLFFFFFSFFLNPTKMGFLQVLKMLDITT